MAAEFAVSADAITIAAVIGACRHIVLMRTTYIETRTVAARASGSTQACGPPTIRKMRPDAPPTATLARRHLNMRRASPGCGSDDAIIDAIAQIGFASLRARRVCQTIVVPTATLRANNHPSNRSYGRPSRIVGL